ncbi:hypothetical protein EGC86_09835 [Shewanella frigidimarina]|nr:hypothetical protein EGC86_09835 [Shewanella frigidimarina]
MWLKNKLPLLMIYEFLHSNCISVRQADISKADETFAGEKLIIKALIILTSMPNYAKELNMKVLRLSFYI